MCSWRAVSDVIANWGRHNTNGMRLACVCMRISQFPGNKCCRCLLNTCLHVRHANQLQKERMQPDDMFVLDVKGDVVHTPAAKPLPNRPPKLSECSPLFMAVSHSTAPSVCHPYGAQVCSAKGPHLRTAAHLLKYAYMLQTSLIYCGKMQCGSALGKQRVSCR